MIQPTRQRGFSLMELMIAIMILGIGTVMVATVFPIGIDLSRQAIQANLAPAVLQSAATALKVKVPPRQEFDGIPNSMTARVLVPDTEKIELDPENLPFCNITQQEYEVLENLKAYVESPPPTPGAPVSYMDWYTPDWDGLDAFLANSPPNVVDPPSGQDASDFVSRTRVFTERSGWANAYNMANPQHEAYLVPSQNLPFLNWEAVSGMALDEFLSELPTMPCQTFQMPGYPRQEDYLNFYLPRISFIDQVYPPVALTYTDPATGETVDRPTEAVAADLASRRYSWIALHHKISSTDRQDMLATVAVFHRADLMERYARQLDLGTTEPGDRMHYDLNDDNHLNALRQPQPDPPLPNGDPPPTDRMFPQPWLVMFDSVDMSAGEITCSGRVAQLLPAGSFFVVANRYNVVDGFDTDLPAGRYFEVLESRFDPAQLDAPATLTVPRSNGGGNNVLAWVFPPPIDRVSGTFSRRSPIAGMGMEVLTFTND